MLHDDDNEIEGVLYKVPDDERDAYGTTDGKVEGAQPYNLRQRQPPTFESYDNPNGIEDLDLESSVDLEPSSFDFSIDIDDTPSNEEANVFYQSTPDVTSTYTNKHNQPNNHIFIPKKKPTINIYQPSMRYEQDTTPP